MTQRAFTTGSWTVCGLWNIFEMRAISIEHLKNLLVISGKICHEMFSTSEFKTESREFIYLSTNNKNPYFFFHFLTFESFLKMCSYSRKRAAYAARSRGSY